jgi:HPt (histidine-containing phosphotransfer) domain-containing protein
MAVAQAIATAPRPDASFELIELPNTLKEKVGSGGFDPIALRRADVAVEEMAPEYEARLQAEVAALDEAFRAMRRAGAFDVDRLFTAAHGLRGEAGTFGYALVSAIGNTLARYLDQRPPLDAAACEVVESHINALRAVVARKVKGDGGEIGAQLVQGLAAMVTRAIG